MTTATDHAKANPSPVRRFAVEYQGYHGISEKRAVRQLREIEAFLRFAAKAPEVCDDGDLRAYLGHLKDRGLHVNTVRWKGNLIRPFFGWMFQAKLIDGHRLMAIREVQNPSGASSTSEPRPYSAKELRQFWTDLDARWPLVEERWFKYWEQGRSRYKRIASHVMRLQIEAIVALALDCGLRRIELFSAEIDHMHYDNAYVVVSQRGAHATGKDHYREVPHTEDSRRAIFEWLEMRARIGVKHKRPWVSAVATQAKDGWLKPMRFDRFEALMSAIGPYELHRFRHTCATNWLRAGTDIQIVQKMLGHTNIQQTLRYAQLVREDVQKQVAANEDRFRRMKGRPNV